VLEYRKPENAIIKHVDDEDKKKVYELSTTPFKGSSIKLNKNKII